MVAAVAGHLLLKTMNLESAGRYVEIPVCYGGRSAGSGVARRVDRSRHEEVIRIHSEARYQVHMFGFVPGFAYLGGLDTRIAMPRHATPRPRVPAGSVAIGGEQTGVYPLDNTRRLALIGRTTAEAFRPGFRAAVPAGCRRHGPICSDQPRRSSKRIGGS